VDFVSSKKAYVFNFTILMEDNCPKINSDNNILYLILSSRDNKKKIVEFKVYHTKVERSVQIQGEKQFLKFGKHFYRLFFLVILIIK
jgi:hypothetical protein